MLQLARKALLSHGTLECKSQLAFHNTMGHMRGDSEPDENEDNNSNCNLGCQVRSRSHHLTMTNEAGPRARRQWRSLLTYTHTHTLCNTVEHCTRCMAQYIVVRHYTSHHHLNLMRLGCEPHPSSKEHEHLMSNNPQKKQLDSHSSLCLYPAPSPSHLLHNASQIMCLKACIPTYV